jgi:hypothetical protein
VGKILRNNELAAGIKSIPALVSMYVLQLIILATILAF